MKQRTKNKNSSSANSDKGEERRKSLDYVFMAMISNQANDFHSILHNSAQEAC